MLLLDKFRRTKWGVTLLNYSMQLKRIRTLIMAHLWVAAPIFWILALFREGRKCYHSSRHLFEIFIRELPEFLFLWFLWFHILKVLTWVNYSSFHLTPRSALGIGTHWQLIGLFRIPASHGSVNSSHTVACIFPGYPPFTCLSSSSESSVSCLFCLFMIKV